MEPLDLTVRPPRGPREKLLGLYFLARTIDKVRAELPGGKLGGYIVAGSRSISAYVFHKLRIDANEFRAVVARATDEDEVVAWLRARVDPDAVAAINAKLEASRVDALQGADRADVLALHPSWANRPDIVSMFDMLEADDTATFA